MTDKTADNILIGILISAGLALFLMLSWVFTNSYLCYGKYGVLDCEVTEEVYDEDFYE